MQWPTKSYLISPKHRLLYCPIPKVACSSIKLWLFELEEGKNESLQSSPHRHTHLYCLKTQQRRVARSALRERDWFRFAFVRNPWARLASAFANKFLSSKSVAVDLLRDYHGWQRRANLWRRTAAALLGNRSAAAAGSEPIGSFWDGPEIWQEQFTFRRFIEFLGRTNLRRVNDHWRPQSLFLTGVKFDFIGRFENLASDFETIRQRTGVEAPLGMRNQTSIDPSLAQGENYADCPLAELRRLPATPSYRSFYTPDLIDIVARAYRDDVELFGYEFEPDLPNQSLSAKRFSGRLAASPSLPPIPYSA